MIKIIAAVAILLTNVQARDPMDWQNGAVDKLSLVKQTLDRYSTQVVSFDLPCTDDILELLSNYPNLESIAFHIAQSQKLPLTKLSALLKLPRLTKIILPNILIPSVQSNIFRQLTNLTLLDLSHSMVSCEVLSIIADLPKLQSLNLNWNFIDDEDITRLEPSCSKLTALYIKGNGLTAKSAMFLGQFLYIQTLYLGSNPIGNNGLRYFEKLQNLEHLDLSNCGINDEGIARLSHNTQLKTLILAENAVTDQSLPILQSFTRLQFLDLQGSSLTSITVSKLQASLPITYLLT